MLSVRFLRCIFTCVVLASGLTTNAAAQIGPHTSVRAALPSPIEVEVRVKDHPRNFITADAVFFKPASDTDEAIFGITIKAAPGLLVFTSFEACIIEDNQKGQDCRTFNVTGHATIGQPILLFMPAGDEFTRKLASAANQLELQPGMLGAGFTAPRILITLQDVNIK